MTIGCFGAGILGLLLFLLGLRLLFLFFFGGSGSVAFAYGAYNVADVDGLTFVFGDGFKDAILLGLAQSIALIPGVSRSGITISAAMFDGFKREQAAVITFLLAAPITAAAGLKQVFDIARGNTEGGTDVGVIAAGVVTSFIVGFAAIAFLIPFLRLNRLTVFVAYRIALGVAVLGLVAAGVL